MVAPPKTSVAPLLGCEPPLTPSSPLARFRLMLAALHAPACQASSGVAVCHWQPAAGVAIVAARRSPPAGARLHNYRAQNKQYVLSCVKQYDRAQKIIRGCPHLSAAAGANYAGSCHDGELLGV